jgi:hypothetical protein
LAAFHIPHVILMDGDGEQAARQRSHANLADALFVLPQDFEHLLVGALSPARLLAVMNECLARRGKPLRSQLDDPRQRAKELANVGKPLVGRVAGELLSRTEVSEMAAVVGTLQGALTLAQNRLGPWREQKQSRNPLSTLAQAPCPPARIGMALVCMAHFENDSSRFVPGKFSCCP